MWRRREVAIGPAYTETFEQITFLHKLIDKMDREPGNCETLYKKYHEIRTSLLVDTAMVGLVLLPFLQMEQVCVHLLVEVIISPTLVYHFAQEENWAPS